jgi:hypothetical protein
MASRGSQQSWARSPSMSGRSGLAWLSLGTHGRDPLDRVGKFADTSDCLRAEGREVLAPDLGALTDANRRLAPAAMSAIQDASQGFGVPTYRAMRRHGSDAMLAVDVPDDLAQRFLAADFPARWLEFCIPAEIVNRLPTKLVPGGR